LETLFPLKVIVPEPCTFHFSVAFRQQPLASLGAPSFNYTRETMLNIISDVV
jgi:hypothetical protein